MKLAITTILILVFSLMLKAQERTETVKPNIIIFYADDLSWKDTQLKNTDTLSIWETPNIVKLAQDGINFTQAYSPAPTCAPSRCSILSGLHPTKTGVTNVSGGGIPQIEKNNSLITPFYLDGLDEKFITIAEVLKNNGYKTGHSGKWHAGNFLSSAPKNQGFEFSFEGRGVHSGAKGKQNRTNHYASNEADDAFKLSNKKYPPYTKDSPLGISYPKDDVTENALSFIKNNKDEPFFLYLAHWMVHWPVHTRNEALLKYYCDKLGMEVPKEDKPILTGGQTNPYFGAMVTTLDWSLGRVVDYLKVTDDPRNPGKKLYETTYIIFSSDNGGCETRGTEVITDNFPLDKGKKYSQEGGIRVPMVVTGPGVAKNITNHEMINQLDYYPTLLNLANIEIEENHFKQLDGLDISDLLHGKKEKVVDSDGKERAYLWWHYPHGYDSQKQSAIRSGDFKLYKNYFDNSYSLYRLYKDGKPLDLEEQTNVANESENIEVVDRLSKKLEGYLKKNKAQLPYRNVLSKTDYPDKEKASLVPKIINNTFNSESRKAGVTIEGKKSNISYGYGLGKVTDNISSQKETKKKPSTHIKFPIETSSDGLSFSAEIPDNVSEFVFILIDEHNFFIKSNLTK
ncbi:sulfatase [Formosa sp. PL04]|uniref:sulfatase n=1 Tax=Formosa sp. PL04 TaxID=3081755 RepID=UPI0029810DD7|nr:sulfatase [Formosa sp. PL04]MDW5290113.1 sulfatase [Formosa sp. PL04]